MERGITFRGCVVMSATIAAIVFPGAALAAPGGNGPDGTGAPGNPHAPGATGNPHQPGATGNPHQGSPPYGVANGHSKSQGSQSNRGSSNGSRGNGSRGNSGGSGSSNAGGGSGNRPVPNSGGGSGGGSPNGPPGKTTICHHTGSDTNPYVQITVANPAVANGHSHHGDLVPAPAGGCEGSAAQSTPSPLDGTATPNALLGAAGAPAAALGAATGGDPGSGSTSASAGGGGGGEGEVAGAVAGDAADPDENEGSSGQLPFTGLALGTLLSVAVMLLFGGWLVRRLGLRAETR